MNINLLKKSTNPYRPIQISILVFLSYFFVTWFRFHEWRVPCLWGDDLHSYVIFCGKYIKSSLEYLPFVQRDLKNPYEKVRFIYHWVSYLEFFFFKKNLAGYFFTNLFLHSLNGCLLCLIAFYFCRVAWLSVALGFASVTAHFGLCEVTQITGIIESMAFLFCLLTILAVIKASKEPFLTKWKWIALLFAFSAFNSHERYIVLLPWLALFFVFHPNAGDMLQRFIFASASVLLIFVNIAVKKFIYHVRFFDGTGGVPLSINLASVKALAAQGLLSIIGMNHGPEYLAGLDWQIFPFFVQIAAITVAVISLIFIIISLLPWRTKKAFNIAWPIYLLVLLFLLLLPAVLTVRIEQRWELASFNLVLLLVSCGFKKLSLSRSGYYLGLFLILVSAVGFIIEESYLTQGFAKVFLMYEQKAAAMVKRTIVDTHICPLGEPILFVSYPGNCNWGLMNGGLFLVYEGKPRSIFCVEKMKDIIASNYPASTKVVFFSPSQEAAQVIPLSSINSINLKQ